MRRRVGGVRVLISATERASSANGMMVRAIGGIRDIDIGSTARTTCIHARCIILRTAWPARAIEGHGVVSEARCDDVEVVNEA